MNANEKKEILFYYESRQNPNGDPGFENQPRLMPDGTLQPFVPFETFGDPKTLNCDRDSQGNVYYADMGVSIVRPRCLEHMEEGLLPQKWMGRHISPIPSWGGCDVDYEWQIPLVEYWLRKHGVVEAAPGESAWAKQA